MGGASSGSEIHVNDEDWIVIPNPNDELLYTTVFQEAIQLQDLSTDPEIDPFYFLHKEAEKVYAQRQRGGQITTLTGPATKRSGAGFISASLRSYLSGTNHNLSIKFSLPNGLLVWPDMEHLSQFHKETTTLKELSLPANYIGCQGVTYLYPVLTQNTSLTSLNLSKNYISDKGWRNLCVVLPKMPCLRTLDLSHNSDVKAPQTLILTQCLFHSSSIRELMLDFTNLGDQAFATLGQLANFRSLTILSVSGNKITKSGVNGFLHSLGQTSSLEKLNLSRNRIDQEGYDAILNFFTENRQLRSLSLAKNKITNPYSCVLDFLARNKTLGSLDVGQAGHAGPSSLLWKAQLYSRVIDNPCLWQLTCDTPHPTGVRDILAVNWDARSYLEESKYPFYLAFEIFHMFLHIKDVIRLLQFKFISLFRRDLARFFQHKKVEVSSKWIDLNKL